jgi:hypothetical protein
LDRHLEHGHHPGEIAERLEKGPKASYLRDLVYGGICERPRIHPRSQFCSLRIRMYPHA